MASYTDRAIALNLVDYSETSQVVVFLTRLHGKVRAIAKGVKRSTRRRFGAAIDLLDIGDITFAARSPSSEGLATLTEWKQRRALLGLRERLERLEAAQYAAEVTAASLGDWDPHPDLHDALLMLLEQLASTPQTLPLLVRYQRTLLTETGAMPMLAACVSCGRVPGAGEPLQFSSFDGGLLCRDCEAPRTEKRYIDGAALLAARGESGDQTVSAARGAFAVLNYHISHLIGRAPRLAGRVVARRARSGGDGPSD